ncbi:UNKNOWN [Stylonychia lemnae]|uniref:Uncharacterized protein n=1 Tax=Stylonychia lemnae TaxID=5949 RepID=A0A078A3W6_STYLE|nr:UNKNOWN [Stylonychia lemnae]|eukprot:CDW76218.1 UNKNOWN [Stylonychia lemnae]
MKKSKAHLSFKEYGEITQRSKSKKVLPGQKKQLELKKEQDRIKKLLQNNYFANNYAARGGIHPSYQQLKSRFPLFEMVVQDDDFMKRLERRKEDVIYLNESVSKNIYNDQEINFNGIMKKARWRSRL